MCCTHLVLPPSVPPSELHVNIRHPSGSLAALRKKLGTQAPQQPASLVEFIQKPAEHVASKTGRRRPCAGGVSVPFVERGHVGASDPCGVRRHLPARRYRRLVCGVRVFSLSLGQPLAAFSCQAARFSARLCLAKSSCAADKLLYQAGCFAVSCLGWDAAHWWLGRARTHPFSHTALNQNEVVLAEELINTVRTQQVGHSIKEARLEAKD